MQYGVNDEPEEDYDSYLQRKEEHGQAQYEATLNLCEKCGAEVFEKTIGDESYRTCPNGCAIGI